MDKFTRKLKLGVLFLLVNGPFGWGALVLCSLLAIRTELVLFHFIGLGLYALSWVMLGVGFYLSGSEGLRYARKKRKKLFVRFFRDS